MACAIPEGVRITFSGSDVVIRPYEVSIKRTERHESEGEFTISQAAGELVNEKISHKQDGYLKIDGNRVFHFLYTEDSLSFRRNFDKENEAILTLYSADKIMEYGTVDNTWKNAKLRDIVEDILDSVDQGPNYLPISGHTAYGSEDISHETLINQPVSPAHAPSSIREFFDIRELMGARMVKAGTVEFDGVTPREAMDEVMGYLNLEWWVDINGMFIYGFDRTWGRSFDIVNSKDTSIERLDIIEPNNKIDTVITSIPYYGIANKVPGISLRGVAQATTTDIDGSPLSLGVSKVETLEEAKYIAKRKLVKESMGDITGSVTINGLATKDKKTLASLTIGDRLTISDGAFDSCSGGGDSGMYHVMGVKHRINSRQGWRVDIDLGRSISNIETSTWYYDPRDDKRYDTIEAYDNSKELL